MNVTLDRATIEERVVIENLTQFYRYDFSELMGFELRDNGRFEDDSLAAYWIDAWRHPFLVRVAGRLAGFALIHERSRLTGASDVFDMAEFFVIRSYRRRGVGLRAAFAAFDRFRGNWELRQRAANVAAATFWRRVISDYTDGSYHEESRNDDVWAGTVQFFSSVGRRAGSFKNKA